MEGESARDALILENLGLVAEAVRRALVGAPRSITPEDLDSAGRAGLVEAANRFRVKENARFSSYAWKWIQAAIADEMRGRDNVQQRGARRTATRLRWLEEGIGRLLHRRPSDGELSEASGLPEVKVRRYLAIGEQEKAKSVVIMPEENEDTTAFVLRIAERMLLPREWSAFRQLAVKGWTLEAVAHEFHKPLNTVRNHYFGALRKLRERLGGMEQFKGMAEARMRLDELNRIYRKWGKGLDVDAKVKKYKYGAKRRARDGRDGHRAGVSGGVAEAAGDALGPVEHGEGPGEGDEKRGGGVRQGRETGRGCRG